MAKNNNVVDLGVNTMAVRRAALAKVNVQKLYDELTKMDGAPTCKFIFWTCPLCGLFSWDLDQEKPAGYEYTNPPEGTEYCKQCAEVHRQMPNVVQHLIQIVKYHEYKLHNMDKDGRAIP